MDGSPHVVRFNATTLWHSDAAEWAPSTASFASIGAGAQLLLLMNISYLRSWPSSRISSSQFQ
jgi:hypothetical protein